MFHVRTVLVVLNVCMNWLIPLSIIPCQYMPQSCSIESAFEVIYFNSYILTSFLPDVGVRGETDHHVIV